MQKKTIIIIVIAVLIVLVLLVAGYFALLYFNKAPTQESLVKIQEDGSKINTSRKLLEEKQMDGWKITNIKLTESNNVTQLLGTITNDSEQEKGDEIITIALLDKEGNEITTLKPYIKKLQPGESTTLNASTTFDYANAYDIAIKK